MTTTRELAIRKTINVGLPVDAAFRLFTERAGDWWPFATRSIHGTAVES